jgi:ABC-2 type transport system permease protein
VLVNPQRNYAQFLAALPPVVIHIVITIAAGYAVGSEFRRAACAPGSPAQAVIRSLRSWAGAAVRDLLFIMLSVVLILEGLFEITFKGDVPTIVAAGHCSLSPICARRAASAPGARPRDRASVSPASWSAWAFGYAGVGFPVPGMNAFAQTWSAFRVALVHGGAVRRLPADCRSPIPPSPLPRSPRLPCFTTARDASPALDRQKRHPPPAPQPMALPAPAPGIGGAFAAEWRRVLAVRGAFIFLVLAPLIYGIYYPQPYLTQILHSRSRSSTTT